MSKKKSDSSDKRKRRIIIEIIIIIIIILLLITSCTATNYFGRLGRHTKNINTSLKKDDKTRKVNKNDKLKFDVENIKSGITIHLQDGKYKLSYSIHGVKPGKYKCSTSNAKIATCVVKDGYVVINPKKKGKVTVTLSTNKNGIKYVAEVKVTIDGYKKSTTGTSGSGTGGNSNTNRYTGRGRNRHGNTGSSSNNKTGTTSGTTSEIVDSGSGSETIAKDKDARLKSLKVGNYNLAPTFNKDVTEYVVAVPSSLTSVNITAKTNSSKASIVSGTGTVELTNDSTTVKVKVKAEDGTTKTYTIKINKKDDPSQLSTDNTLKSLSITGYDLHPEFNKYTTNYNVAVANNVTSLDLSAIPTDDNALVKIEGNSNFKVGENKVTITVTAEDGSTRTYTINVTRVGDNSTKLTNLSVKDHPFDVAFDPDTYIYDLEVDNDVEDLDVIFTKSNDNQTVEVTGDKDLVAGEVNTVKVKVTSEDGEQSTTYKINVYRKEDLSQFYVNSDTTYKVGYKDGEDNYKNIVINSNVINGVAEVKYNDDHTSLTLSDGESTITLSSPKLKLEYISDDSDTTSFVIKVKYDLDSESQTLNVVANRKGRDEVKNYNITFNIFEKYYVTLDSNGGLFNEFATKYELEFYADETLNLFPYNEVYKIAKEEGCKSYKFIGYDSDKNKTKNDKLEYAINSEGKLNYTNIAVNSDMTLFAIFDQEDKSVVYHPTNRLYVTDLDVFRVENDLISPGKNGSVIMHIKNTTKDKMTLTSLGLREDNICISENNCLNMGYIIKRYNANPTPNYQYIFDDNQSYKILNKNADSKVASSDGTDRFTSEKIIDLTSSNIVLKAGKEIEVSLLWKWVDADNDTEIGDFVKDHYDWYNLTIFYEFSVDKKVCELTP